MDPLTYLYLDDSGSRKPDRAKGQASTRFDYFAIGGHMVDAEHDKGTKDSIDAFLARWRIQGPLHSVRIRNRRENFAWLGEAPEAECTRFHDELSALVIAAPVTVVGCIVDRNGYNDRYRERYGDERWHLCKTAFTIVIERAARQALARGRRLRVICEMSGKAEDRDIRAYYRAVRAEGMPFDPTSSAKYSPLAATDFQRVLTDLEFKDKASRGLQLADLVLYPIAKGGYDPGYRPYRAMKEAGKLLDCILPEEDIPAMGVKYSCFPERARPVAAKVQETGA